MRFRQLSVNYTPQKEGGGSGALKCVFCQTFLEYKNELEMCYRSTVYRDTVKILCYPQTNVINNRRLKL